MTLNKILEDPNGINEADLLIIESKFSEFTRIFVTDVTKIPI